MSETDSLTQKIEARITSGQPFTFADVWMPLADGDFSHPAYRLADKTIQKWRRQGRIAIDGRKGRAPLWHLRTPPKGPIQ